MQIDDMHLDGNAAAGMLSQVFSREMTTAMGTCVGCGAASPVGRLMNYGGEMGVILRCPACDTVMLRMVSTPGWIRLDASGTALFEIRATL
jgi:hypothetical protein